MLLTTTVIFFLSLLSSSAFPRNYKSNIPLKRMSKVLKMTKILVLFDVDGTLTEPRDEASEEMQLFLQDLKKKVTVGIIGGSDLVKQQEQMGAKIVEQVNYSFSENGLVAYKDGLLIGKKAISDELGEENIKKLINFSLKYIADLDIPIKRGTFIEYRAGMVADIVYHMAILRHEPTLL